MVTQYNPAAGGSQAVTYYPGGDSAGTLTTVNKLQVPFVIGYHQGSRAGRRQGHDQAQEGQGHQDHHRQAQARHGDCDAAEAGQGHLEGLDLIPG
jgi:hypothetical protein